MVVTAWQCERLNGNDKRMVERVGSCALLFKYLPSDESLWLNHSWLSRLNIIPGYIVCSTLRTGVPQRTVYTYMVQDFLLEDLSALAGVSPRGTSAKTLWWRWKSFQWTSSVAHGPLDHGPSLLRRTYQYTRTVRVSACVGTFCTYGFVTLLLSCTRLHPQACLSPPTDQDRRLSCCPCRHCYRGRRRRRSSARCSCRRLTRHWRQHREDFVLFPFFLLSEEREKESAGKVCEMVESGRSTPVGCVGWGS